jgi:hypothetical protein
MANEKNLIPMNKRDKDEALKIQRRGGQAFKEKKRKQRAMKEITMELLNQGMSEKALKGLKQSFPELKGEEITAGVAILLGQIEKAIKGRDTKASEFVRDTSGQKPVDRKEIEKTQGYTIDKMIDDKLIDFEKMNKK